MFQRSARGRFLEISLFTLSSLVLYHIGVGIGVFLIPLQVLASRRGEGSLLLACGGFLLVFLALRFLPFLGGALRPDILTVVEIVFVVFLLLGLLVVNFPPRAGRQGGATGRTLYRLLGCTAAAGLAAIPLALWLSRSSQFQEATGALFTEVSRMLTSLFTGKETTTDPMLSALLSPEALRRMSEAYLSRSLLAMYFALLAFSWWAGQASAFRAAYPGSARFRFSGFRLESFWLWPLIAASALILADLFLNVHGFGRSVTATAHASAQAGWWAYAPWNVGLVLMILYGLQGLAILRFLFERRRFPRLLWLLLLIGLAALAASPKAGLFVMLGLPAFGISEHWIRYRTVADGKQNESD